MSELFSGKKTMVRLVVSAIQQAQLFNKLRLRRHLLHKRRAWPCRLALAEPSARRGFPLFSCFNVEPCNDYLIL